MKPAHSVTESSLPDNDAPSLENERAVRDATIKIFIAHQQTPLNDAAPRTKTDQHGEVRSSNNSASAYFNFFFSRRAHDEYSQTSPPYIIGLW